MIDKRQTKWKISIRLFAHHQERKISRTLCSDVICKRIFHQWRASRKVLFNEISRDQRNMSGRLRYRRCQASVLSSLWLLYFLLWLRRQPFVVYCDRLHFLHCWTFEIRFGFIFDFFLVSQWNAMIYSRDSNIFFIVMLGNLGSTMAYYLRAYPTFLVLMNAMSDN